jgi:hypothetical protein
VLRATLAVPEPTFQQYSQRLRDAVLALIGPSGPRITVEAAPRARRVVADLDTIIARLRY